MSLSNNIESQNDTYLRSGNEGASGSRAINSTEKKNEAGSLKKEYIERYAPEGVQHLYASILIDELIRLGVGPFIISPGMRAVPLLMALEGPLLKNFKEPARRILVNDERSAGFFAVGAAKGGALPCLICTSGTAVANYHPAVIEAWYSRIPLLILTTDRPWELQNAGANQTIHQKDMFRDCAVQCLDLPAPETNIHVHSLLSSVDYLIAKARTELRPVHLNLGFRKPFYVENFQAESCFSEQDLYSLKKWIGKKEQGESSAYCNIDTGRSVNILESVVNKVSATHEKNKKKVLLIAGPSHSVHWERRAGFDLKEKVFELAEKLQVPVIADIHSNIRNSSKDEICSAYQWYLRSFIQEGNFPDTVLYVGDRIISTACQEFLEELSKREDVRIIKFQTHTDREDAIENEFIHFSEVTPFFEKAVSFLPEADHIDQSFSRSFFDQEKEYRKQLKDLLDSEQKTERAYISKLMEALPAGTRIMLSASSVFREADYFVHDIQDKVTLYGNRGATGIDGIISTGIGLSIASEEHRPVFILLGDQAALHDLTGLSLLRHSDQPIIVAIVNNQGGALFNIVDKSSLLPVLLNQHSLSFGAFAEGFGASYHKADSVEDALTALHEAFSSKKHLVLEISVDGKESIRNLRSI